MAFPSVVSRTITDIETGATSHNINVGSPSAGNLILNCMRTNTGPGTVTFTGYTPLVNGDSTDASNDATFIWVRQADGTEGASDPLTTTNTCKIEAVNYVISGAEDPGTQPPEVSTVAVGTTAANTCDPANL